MHWDVVIKRENLVFWNQNNVTGNQLGMVKVKLFLYFDNMFIFCFIKWPVAGNLMCQDEL